VPLAPDAAWFNADVVRSAAPHTRTPAAPTLSLRMATLHICLDVLAFFMACPCVFLFVFFSLCLLHTHTHSLSLSVTQSHAFFLSVCYTLARILSLSLCLLNTHKHSLSRRGLVMRLCRWMRCGGRVGIVGA
jgi:hypothetical protein